MEKTDKKSFKLSTLHIALIVVAIVVIVAIVYFAEIGNASQSVVANGDNVSVYYTGTFTNGTVFNTNVGNQTFNFTVGANQVIPGFNNAVIGMRVGQNKTVTLPPDEAYGNINQSLIFSVSRSDFGNSTITVGMMVRTTSDEEAEVLAVNATNVTVDFNPPLAGKTLIFDIKLVAIHS